MIAKVTKAAAAAAKSTATRETVARANCALYCKHVMPGRPSVPGARPERVESAKANEPRSLERVGATTKPRAMMARAAASCFDDVAEHALLRSRPSAPSP